MGNWDAKIFINEKYGDTIKLENNDSLKTIREKSKHLIPNDGEYYYFTSKSNYIIEKASEGNYNASKIYKEDNDKSYRIDLKSKLYHEGKPVDIYINSEKKSTIKLKGDIPSLKKIRELCKNIIPVDDHYYFITNNNEIIKLEDNYNTLDVLQKDGEKKYKIDFKSVEFYENKPLLINVYLNGHKDSAIFVERKSDLSKVKQKLDSNISNNEKIFFATKGNFPIKNNNIKEFKIEDIIITEGNEKNINMYELNYYIKIKLIKDLKEMDKEIDNGNSIDWFQQAEFFVNVKELAGPEIANGIKEGLEKDLDGQAENDGNSPGNDECTNEKERKLRKDKEFIKKYLKLLLRDLDNSPPPSTA